MISGIGCDRILFFQGVDNFYCRIHIHRVTAVEMISFTYFLAVTLIPVTLCKGGVFVDFEGQGGGEDVTTCSGSLVITNTDGEETKFDSNETLQGEVTNIKRCCQRYNGAFTGKQWRNMVCIFTQFSAV